jgi:hypothetical protein
LNRKFAGQRPAFILLICLEPHWQLGKSLAKNRVFSEFARSFYKFH